MSPAMFAKRVWGQQKPLSPGTKKTATALPQEECALPESCDLWRSRFSSSRTIHLETGSTTMRAACSSLDQDQGAAASAAIYHPKSFRSISRTSIDHPSMSEFALATLRCVKGKLYGRDAEIVKIKQAVLAKSDHTTVMLAGSSGVGKTALAHQLRQPVLQQGGIYVSGKYAFSAQAIPFPGITEACRKICRHLIRYEHDCVSEEQRQELRDALGSSVYLLANILPNVFELLRSETQHQPVLDEEDNPIIADMQDHHHHQQQQQSLSGTITLENVGEFQNRFRFAMGTFIRVVASWMPVVMVLDDLQWADSESMDLVTNWIHHDRIPGLVLVGCYRSNEVDESHIMCTCLRELQQAKHNIVRIELHNLNQDSVNEMLADVLTLDQDATKQLATVVHKKTLGNPFFVIQYLRNLYQLGILKFSMGLTKWMWNLDEVEAHTNATENVVHLMQTRMKTLPIELYKILPLAACLGSSFQSSVLSVVVQAQMENDSLEASDGIVVNDPTSESDTGLKSEDERNHTAQFLDLCAEEGFLIQDDHSTTYTWMHDKIEEAAISIINPRELEKVQFGVGKVLYSQLKFNEVRQNIYVIVNLLNKGLCFSDDADDSSSSIRTDIARLNLQAGREAMQSTSFAQAAEYLKNGIEWLPKFRWTNEYALSLELYTSAAEAEYGAGEVERSEAYARLVVSRKGCPFMDKLRAYSILIPCIQCRNQTSEEASHMAVFVLEKLGCKIPKKRQLFYVLRDLGRLKVSVKRMREGSSTIGSRYVKDESRIRAMRLMDKLVTLAYHNGSLYLPLAIMKGFRWIERYGLSEYAPASLALVGLLLMSQKDFDGGRACAKLAMNLIETDSTFESSFSRTIFVCHCFILHASMPHRLLLKQFLRGYESGRKTGDVENACWNSFMFLEYSFILGKNLDLLDQDFEIYNKEFFALSQFQQWINSTHPWQAARNLMGRSESPFLLQGDIFDIESFRPEKFNRTTVVSTYLWQIVLYHFLCEDEKGADIALELFRNHPRKDRHPGSLHEDLTMCHSAIVCYGAMRKTRKRKWLSLGKKCHKHIKQIGKNGNPNFHYFDALLDAEFAAWKGQEATAKKSFETSIFLVGRMGLINQHALVNERFADYMVECGDGNEAAYRYENAIDLYYEWGAKAKVELVQAKLASLSLAHASVKG